MEFEIGKFDPTIAEVKRLADEYTGLNIKNVDDVIGYACVDAARKALKKTRCDITNRGKELRGQANAFAKDVIAREKELIAVIEPVEVDLYREKMRIDNMAKMDGRRALLLDVDYEATDDELLTMTDVQFNKAFDRAKLVKFDKQEAERKKAEELDRVRQEAAAAAKQEAEEKAREEKEAAEKKAREEKEAAEKKAQEEKVAAEREKQEAIIKAKEDALIAERERARKEKEDLEKSPAYIAQKKKEADEEKQRILEAEHDRQEKERIAAEILAKKDKKEAERADYIDKWKKKNNYNELTDTIEVIGNKMFLIRKIDFIYIK